MAAENEKALDVLGMSEEEQAKLTTEEVEFYSDSVRQAAEEAAATDPAFREALRKKAEEIIARQKEGQE